jgi:formate dehydrogenase subunit gamma
LSDFPATRSKPEAAARPAIEQALAEHKTRPGALLPILHSIQDAIGYVPTDAIPPIATALNLSRAEVHGVITFYHHFRPSPPGRHIVQLCRAEACQSMGSAALAEEIKAQLGIDFHQTSADGTVSLEAVYCLGNCACSPAVMIDGQLHGRVTAERFQQLLRTAEEAT